MQIHMDGGQNLNTIIFGGWQELAGNLLTG